MKSYPKHPLCKYVAVNNLKKAMLKKISQGLLLLMELNILIMMTRAQTLLLPAYSAYSEVIMAGN